LVDEHLPQTIYSNDPSDWWSTAGPALIARAARTLHSVRLLFGTRADLDAAVLTRVMFEQLVRFGYLAHDPATRLLAWESADHEQSQKITNSMHALGCGAFSSGVWPDALGPRPAPLKLGVRELSDRADVEWPDAIGLFLEPGALGRPFRVLYEAIYRAASRSVHGSAYVTGPFIELDRAPTIIVHAHENARSVIAYEWAVLCFGILLAIAATGVGWPRRDRLKSALAPHLAAGS
jgi:hypothetical protein